MKKLNRLIHIGLRLTLFIIYISGFVFLFSSLIQNKDGIKMNENIQHATFDGTVSLNGETAKDSALTNWHLQSTQSVVAVGHLSHDITDDQSLIIWPRNLRVKLYVNGVEKISTGQREEFPDFIQYAGNSFQCFYIGHVTTTDQIRIEINKAYTSCRINVIDTFFDNIYIGKEGDLYQSIMTNEMLHPLTGTILMLLGITILLAGILQDIKYARHIYYLGWFCILGGITYIYDSSYEFIDLLLPFPVINTLIDLLCVPFFLFFYLLFICNMVQSRQAKFFMKWVIIIFSISELLPLTLQITGYYDLHEMQDQYMFIGGYAILCGGGSIIYEIIRHKKKDMIKILIPVLPLMLTLFPKMINILMEQGVERTFLRIGILVSCILLTHYIFRYLKQSTDLIAQEREMKEELQNARISIMLSQIHPHFLYNALNTLQHICKKDGVLAAEAIGHFSKYLRGNMDSLTNDHMIPFDQELDHVNHYLYIQKLRFGERLKVEYDLKETDFCIPTLTLQPIVENAVRHGITKQAEGGTVWIETKLEKNEILIIVTDNGVGFDGNETSDSNRSHVGIQNVRKRLELQGNATLTIVSRKGEGTTATIRMKGAHSKKNENNCSR